MPGNAVRNDSEEISSRDSIATGQPEPRMRRTVRIQTVVLLTLINLLLQWSCSWFYIQSLEGGDLEWIKRHLGWLGANLLLSLACFFGAFAMLLLVPSTTLPRPLHLGLGLTLALLLYSLQRYDNGEGPQRHGFYNFLIFAVIAVPVNALIACMCLCYKCMSPRRFLRVSTTVLVVSTVLVSTSLVYYTWAWNYGALGHRLDNGRECSWSPGVPFIDLLPNGIMNVWTGRQWCPAPTPALHAMVAEWTQEEGRLTIQCPDNLVPSFKVLPDTRQFKTDEKKEGTFHKAVAQKCVGREYSGPVVINDTRLQVIVAKCSSSNSTPVLEKLLLRVGPPNPETVSRVWPVVTEYQKRNTGGRPPPNILLVFLDAVSRRQFFRKMPKTAAVLESLAAGSDGNPPATSLHQFFRYHSLGFSTDPNTRALYTNSADKHVPALAPNWRDFQESGLYMTARIETNCEDWSTQYTGQTSSQFLDHELLAPFCLPEYYPAEGNPFGNFQGPYSIVARCLAGRYVHSYALEYANKLRHAYSNASVPWFIMASFIEGHEGSGEVLLTLDQDLANFFSDLKGELDNTVVVLLSDHGLHMGLNFLFTTNGKVEHMNPLLMLMMPPALESAYPSMVAGLRHTEQLLLTPFEVYATLKGFARGLPSREEEGAWRKGTLFDEEMKSRDCEEARIPESFCKCK